MNAFFWISGWMEAHVDFCKKLMNTNILLLMCNIFLEILILIQEKKNFYFPYSRVF